MLGPDGRGELALAMAIALMIAQMAMGGIGTAVSHAVAAADLPARTVVGPHLVRWFIYSAAVGLVTAGTTYVALRASGNPDPLGLSLASAGLGTLSTTNQLISAMLRGERDLRAVTVVPIVATTTYVLGVVTCFLVFSRADAAVIILLFMAGQVIGITLGWRRLLPAVDGATADGTSLARRSRRSWATSLNPLSMGLDHVVVALTLGPAALGLYVVAVSTTNLPGMALRPVATMLMPRLVASSPQARSNLVRRWLLAAAALDVAMVLALEIIIGPAISVLFGAAFAPAIPVARIAIVAWGFLAFRLMFTAVLQAYDRAGTASLIEVATTVAMVPAVWAGATLGGVEGAATAMALFAALCCGLSAAAIRLRRSDQDQPSS
jgi:O-antigen/teichoic acid export membrane protein